VLGEEGERPVHVDDEVEAPERGLVCADAGKAAPGHAVDDEGRDAHRVQLALPVADVAAGPARAVHQDHHRQPALALRDRQLATERRRLGAGLVAGEELLIREREGLERMQLDAHRHVARGEGVGGSRARQKTGADKPDSNCADHFFLPRVPCKLSRPGPAVKIDRLTPSRPASPAIRPRR